MVVPILLTVAFLGTNLHNLKYSPANVPLVTSVATIAITPSLLAAGSMAAFEVFLSLVLSFFSISLAVYTLVTGLIITKILTVYRDISPSRVGYANRLWCDIVRILIESGVMTFGAQLAQIVMFKFSDGNAYPIIGRFVIMLFVRSFILKLLVFFDYIYPIMQGISTTIVLVRVELGLTDDVDNTTLKTLEFMVSVSSSNDDTLP